MTSLRPVPRSSVGATAAMAVQALRAWTFRQMLVAILVGIAVAVLIGVATVLIPNPIFTREIPPVWWNYPVWLLTAALSGMLAATYVRASANDDSAAAGAATDATGADPQSDAEERRSSRMGLAGGLLAWFAVGCPVCNKLALLALGYSGAITWFAPVQPFLAIGALLLTGVALIWRLRGQISCAVRPPQKVAAR